MDWFSWLSKTSLEPSLIYEYGVAFAHNELQAEDLAYFDHEFLQSMGISVAKHRLEILKLARKEVGAGSNGLSKLILVINKAKKTIKRHIGKMVFHQDSPAESVPEPLPYQGQCRRAFSVKGKTVEKPPMVTTRRQAKSGPLDRRVQEKLMSCDKSLKLSGPLNGKVNERLMLAYRSPKLYGTPDWKAPKSLVTSKSPQLLSPWSKAAASPMVYSSEQSKERTVNGDYYDHSLWAALFRDMKPT